MRMDQVLMAQVALDYMALDQVATPHYTQKCFYNVQEALTEEREREGTLVLT